MNCCPVVPAVIPKSREHVLDMCEKLAWSSEFHLDLVDGKFVPTISWPYEPVGDPLSIKSALDHFTLEVDLMVADPLKAAAAWESAGADMLVFHIETISLDDFRQFADRTKVSVGVSMHGATSLENLLTYVPDADYVQLMGIYEIGAQGQPFDEAILEKIQLLKDKFPNIMISVDGSVNSTTIVRLRNAGADRFIVGSAIVLQEDPEAAHASLRVLVNE